jgi:hypothetical protein
MSKDIIIKDLTSQLIQMNFICSYHPKYDLYSDMFFDCQNSDEEPAKINLILAISIDEKHKQLKYYHRISEYIILDTKKKMQLTEPIDSFHQFVSYQTVTGKTKHIYLDPEEIAEFFKLSCEKHGYSFTRIQQPLSSQIKESVKAKRSTKESVPTLTIITLFSLTALSLYFNLIPRNWILSLILAIIFILSAQMIPTKKWLLTAGWVTLQILIWLIY